MSTWRAFNFFGHEPVKGALETQEITASCVGRGCIVLGDGEGNIKLYDRSGTLIPNSEFQAYTSIVTHVKYVRTRNVLVTIGDDDAVNLSIVRVWDLDKLDAKGRPASREHRIFSPKFPIPDERIPVRINYNSDVVKKLRFSARSGVNLAELSTAVVSFDVSEDLQHLAIGLANNDIVAVKGDLERDRSPKIRRIQTGLSSSKLTFVGFPRIKTDSSLLLRNQSASFNQLLYAVHEDITLVWRISAKGEYQDFAMEPAVGAPYECAALNDDGQLAVAPKGRSEVAFFGGADFMAEMSMAWDTLNLRALTFVVIEGNIRRIGFHKNYLTVLTQNERKVTQFNFQAYDPEGKIRALNSVQQNHYNVVQILADVNEIIVIAQDPKTTDSVQQKVTKITEMDTQAKLDQLFKKDMYDEAKRMAKRLGAANNEMQLLMDIQRRYGDHMYGKGKYREAIDQYIEAIGFLEPSYVIRRFLDAQRITHLTRYLEELHHERHKEAVANKNHTTLLLNCYTKLNDHDKLDAFIHREDIRFDAHNAIKVCQQAGYFESAVYLAERYNQPSDYVKIHLENLDKPNKVLTFLTKMSVDVAEGILMEHGKELIERVPDVASDLLVELCTAWPGPNRRADAFKVSRGYGNFDEERMLPPNRANADDFIHVFVDSPAYLLKFLEGVVASGVISAADSSFDEDGKRVVYNTLIELYLTENLRANIKNVIPTDSSSPTYQIPSLETRRESCYRILRDHEDRYDPYHALALVQQHRYDAGILYMLQTLNLYSEIFLHYAKRFQESTGRERDEAKRMLIQTCHDNHSTGSEEQVREMWISLLSLLVMGGDSEDITRVLEHIQSEDLLPPVAVIEILSQNENLELETVREYVLQMLKEDQVKVDEHQRAIKQHSDKITALKSDIRELQTQAVVFQNSVCTLCHGQLDLPAVHFLCKHSFHQRCLNDPPECTKCGPETRRLVQIQKELDEKVNDHNEFFKEIGDATDGFGVVADYFGRGIFSAPQLRKEAQLMAGTGSYDEEFDEDGNANVTIDGDDDDDGVGDGMEDDLDIEALETW